MTAPQALTLLVVAAGVLTGLTIAFSEPYGRWRQKRRRSPVTDSNRAMRDRVANVVLNADPATIALVLVPREAELAGLQQWADQLAAHDRKDAGR